MNNTKETLTITDNIAIIQEMDCIGCTKCIKACPVDAILGAAKQMHTVLREECIGCELCVKSCPVDCITMLPTDIIDNATRHRKLLRAHQRFDSRELRLRNNRLGKTKRNISQTEITQTRKDTIRAALLRVQKKQKTWHSS